MACSRPPEPTTRQCIPGEACRGGVRRSHIVSYAEDGALLNELFTRDGAGTLVAQEQFEQLREADINDVGGLLELIRPLEEQGILVRRSREVLEREIERIERGEEEPSLLFGLRAIDALTDGLGRGEVGIICGRPATGKSIWCAMPSALSFSCSRSLLRNQARSSGSITNRTWDGYWSGRTWRMAVSWRQCSRLS